MSDKDEIFNIQWDGLNELEEMFDSMEQDFVEIAIDEYSKYGQLVEEGSKALAPHDEGHLEESISFDKAKIKGDEVVVEGGSNSVYALRRHEEPYREGKHPKYDNGSKFDDYYENGRGEGTRGKTPWRGYEPGRKYMQNAINATEEDYNKMNERILDRTLEGRK